MVVYRLAHRLKTLRIYTILSSLRWKAAEPSGINTGVWGRALDYIDDERGYYTLDNGATYHLIPIGAQASMNLWAFSEGFIDDIEESFALRFKEGVIEKPDSFEETISDAVQSILERDKGTVRCIPVDEEWFGMTYSEELSLVKERLNELREEGVYVRETW